jgi:uncharacterized protein
MEQSSKSQGIFLVLALLVLACGIGYASTNVYKGLKEFKSYDRFVSVKGLAQKEVVADLALWPISYTETGNDLSALQGLMDTRGASVISFLKKYDITDAEIELQQVNVQDLMAQGYRQENVEQARYILTQTYMVRTNNVTAVYKAAQNMGELIKQGVVVAQGSGLPTYLYTKLNDIKPEMIAQATQNARAAAAQFAKDSGQAVGDIRTAYQGIFQILARDDTYAVSEPQQVNKTVRVVSTVDFYLK